MGEVYVDPEKLGPSQPKGLSEDDLVVWEAEDEQARSQEKVINQLNAIDCLLRRLFAEANRYAHGNSHTRPDPIDAIIRLGWLNEIIGNYYVNSARLGFLLQDFRTRQRDIPDEEA